ncbi:hypothetical protein TSUD_143700 [Trifolium subterraneum]|uniref:Methyltransferase type 11 domain-containing protein n=1 Tax=Trifolium subterraneum TaxID=3900 RepID=A0A2Z6N1P1_TRISU|nr:hypothetical protein TSUD_143700 [Trifolium subterraneum]
MSNFVGIRLPVVACYCWCATPNPPPPRTIVGSSSCSLLNRTFKNVPRRMLLGFGASSLTFSHFMSTSSSGVKSFIASARITSGPSVDQVCPVSDMCSKPQNFPLRSSDSTFYEAPRFVTHIDDPAIAALTKYYSKVFPPSNTPGVSILDMCSSWVSHFPSGYKQERVIGLGMNEEELKRNPVLTEYVVQDLNVNPKLPFGDNSFDVITNVVSVDYLTKPLDIFKEMSRILKPGGLAIMR